MRELVLTDDPVLVNFVETLLRDAGITVHVFDRYAAQLHGAVGRAPQRVVVAAEDWDLAAEVLADAELGQWIVNEGYDGSGGRT